MLRRLAHIQPIPAVFWLLLCIAMLVMPAGAVPTPVLAQQPDTTVVIQADQRHLRPDISSTTFGEEVAPEQSSCATITFHMYGAPKDLQDYSLSLQAVVDLRAGSVTATLSGSGTRESKSGTATCTWEGTATKESHVTFVRDQWRFRAEGELTLRCSGQYACAGARDAQGNRIVAAGAVAHTIPFSIEGEATPGEDPRLYIRGAMDDQESDPPVTWYFNMLSNEDAPPLGAPFPAYPLVTDTATPAATATPLPTHQQPTATAQGDRTPIPSDVTPTRATPERTSAPTVAPPLAGTPETAATPGATGIARDDLGTAAVVLTGGHTQPPTPGRAAAAAAASVGLVAAGTAVRLIGSRAKSAAGKPAAQSDGQANQLQAMRARWTQALAERTYKVMTLEAERDRLDRRIHDLEAQHQLECTAGAVDGVLDGANLLVSIVGGPATAVGAAGLNAFWDVARLGVRAAVARRLGTASGIDPLTDPAKMAAGAAGVPLNWNAPGGAAGQVLQNAAARQSRAAIRGMGRALGPLQSFVAMGQNAHTHAQRTAWLRSQLRGARSRRALVNRQLMDVRADADEARSALQSTNDAIQQLRAQFPNRFATL